MGVKGGIRFGNSKYIEIEVVEFGSTQSRVKLTGEINGKVQSATAILKAPAGTKTVKEEAK